MDIKPQSDKATFTFGRFNPIHLGHKKLIDAVVSHAWKEGGEHHIYLSHTQDAKKNPLTHSQKVDLTRKMFPHVTVRDEAEVKTPIDALHHLHKAGYKRITMLTGSDRQQEFHNLLHKYKPSGVHLEVKSAGDRDPDSDSVEGFSASKMRDHAAKKNFGEFKKGVPNPEHARDMYHAVRKGMKLENFQKHFKALFLVGGPGSGKDFIITSLLEDARLIELPLDKFVKNIVEQTNIDIFDNYPALIVNGNADDYDKIAMSKQVLESMGYDTAMIYVYTSDEESKSRNDERISRGAKTFTEEVRHEKYTHSIQNMHTFIPMFEHFHIFDNSYNFSSVGAVRKQEILGWLNELGESLNSFFGRIPSSESSVIWLMEEAEPPSATNNVYHMYPAHGKKRKSPVKKGKTDTALSTFDSRMGAVPQGSSGVFAEGRKRLKLKIKNKGEKEASPPPDFQDQRMGMTPSSGEGLVSTFSEEKTFQQLRKNISAVIHNIDSEE